MGMEQWGDEGYIHRLTFLKRQGYGRIGFALIHQRVLLAA